MPARPCGWLDQSSTRIVDVSAGAADAAARIASARPCRSRRMRALEYRSRALHRDDGANRILPFKLGARASLPPCRRPARRFARTSSARRSAKSSGWRARATRRRGSAFGSAPGRRNLHEKVAAAARHELRQLAVPLREVLLLDEGRGQRLRHLGVVFGLGGRAEPEGGRLALRARLERRTLSALAGHLRFGLALGLIDLVALLLGDLLGDLLALNRLLEVLVEPDVLDGDLGHLYPIFQQPLGEAVLDVRLDLRALLEDVVGGVDGRVRLEYLGGGRIDDRLLVT